MPHWRSMMDREYLGAWDVPTDKVATIERVEGVKLQGNGTIKSNKKPVISFRGTSKKLIVNATIGKAIANMYGPDTDHWVGKKVTLYATTTNSQGGEQVECVRVRPMVPRGPAGPIASQPVDPAMRERQRRGAGEPPDDAPPVDEPPQDEPKEREPGEEG